MARIEKTDAMQIEVHPKKWGTELWIENCDDYCGKVLHFTKMHGSTSLHFHINKLETMYLLSGKLLISLVDTETGEWYDVILFPGDKIMIPRNQPHRLQAMVDDTKLIEFSTHHEDSDSYRVIR